VARSAALGELALGTLRRPPRDPLVAARFGLDALRSARSLAARFETDGARALVAGLAAHAGLPLTSPMTAGFALLLAVAAHRGGWPVVEGGSGALVDALCGALADAGGTVRADHVVTDLAEFDSARAILCDTSPTSLVAMAGDRLAPREQAQLRRLAPGPGVCKVDWALSGPVPWAATVCREAATVHLGATFEEVAASEAAVAAGRVAERPFVIAVQPCVADPTRAPAGKHILWAYCHVPTGSDLDRTEAIESQVERFAPGFRDLVLARSTRTTAILEAHNANLAGGDISGGASTLRQTLLRPTPRWDAHRTSARGVYLCSASTPPGGGVHGMCGVHAARSALRAMGVASLG
jgi:phytoene dehydrogenase-like protein